MPLARVVKSNAKIKTKTPRPVELEKNSNPGSSTKLCTPKRDPRVSNLQALARRSPSPSPDGSPALRQIPLPLPQAASRDAGKRGRLPVRRPHLRRVPPAGSFRRVRAPLSRPDATPPKKKLAPPTHERVCSFGAAFPTTTPKLLPVVAFRPSPPGDRAHKYPRCTLRGVRRTFRPVTVAFPAGFPDALGPLTRFRRRRRTRRVRSNPSDPPPTEPPSLHHLRQLREPLPPPSPWEGADTLAFRLPLFASLEIRRERPPTMPSPKISGAKSLPPSCFLLPSTTAFMVGMDLQRSSRRRCTATNTRETSNPSRQLRVRTISLTRTAPGSKTKETSDR